jgi:hypothetical protein
MEKKLKPCRFCGHDWPLALYGGDTGKPDAETSIHCDNDECKMNPMVSALFYNDAVAMWNAAMTVEKKS